MISNSLNSRYIFPSFDIKSMRVLSCNFMSSHSFGLASIIESIVHVTWASKIEFLTL